MTKSRKFSVRLLKREKTFEDARKDLSNLNEYGNISSKVFISIKF